LQGNALKEETDPALQALSDREPEQPWAGVAIRPWHSVIWHGTSGQWRLRSGADWEHFACVRRDARKSALRRPGQILVVDQEFLVGV